MITRVIVKVLTHDGKILEEATTPIQVETYKGDLLKDIYLTLRDQYIANIKDSTGKAENK